MKPGFALLLSHDGLILSHRTSEGWLRIGEVSLDDPDVTGALARLRGDAVRLAKAHKLAPLRTKLVLPNSEILYETVSVEGVTSPDYDGAIREQLDGRTPYALDELCYDYVVSGSAAQVAVVARETLAEAEAFAVEHRLAPVCFAAVPPKGAFSGEVMFGTTKAAERLLGPDEIFERDMAPVVLLGEAEIPEATAAPEPTKPEAPAPEPAAQAPEPTPEAEPETTPADAARKAPEIKAPPAPARPGAAPKLAPPPSFASARAKSAEAVPKAPETVRAPLDVAPRLDLAAADTEAGRTPPLAAPAPVAKRRPIGLMLTLALLVVLVLVGVIAALTGGHDATETPTTDPVAPAVELAQVPEPEPETGPAETAVETDGTGSAPTGVPVVAMTTGPEALAPATPQQLTSPFTAAPTPEEVAEGDEANVDGPPPVDVAALPPTPALPDIDALPAQGAPAGPQAADSARPALIETETRYAATGIWQRSPDPLLPPAETGIADLYVAALDRDIAIEDALALPDYREARDLRPVTQQPPIAPGQFFELDADGLVAATPEGALTPEGVLVFSAPEVRPDPRPRITPAVTDADLARESLAEQRPPARPENATELQERAVLDGRSRAELAAVAPSARPASIQDLAETPDPAESEANGMVASLIPERRPADFAAQVASLRAARQAAAAETASAASTAAPRNPAQAASLAATAPPPQQQTREAAPSIPTTASVARQATIENAMRLNSINLIGVYGTPNSRRALVRLASGRYVKLEVGDRVDGGRVAAIGESSLQYTKGGRSITLEMPRG